MSIAEVLLSLGADPVEVLAAAGYEPAFFDKPDARMSFAARNRLLAHCARATGCKHFGLLVGQHVSLLSLGLIGSIVRSAPDVGSALRSLVRYLHLHVRGATASLQVEGDTAMFTWDIYQPWREGVDQAGDGALASIRNIISDLCGPSWTPREVRFAHPAVTDSEPFQRCFSARLRFGAERNAVLFGARWLARPLPVADPQLLKRLQEQIGALEVRHAGEFSAQVRSVLSGALLTDDAGVERIAALFSMHSRTLHRRLASYGTSFRELAEESRFQLSRQLLDDARYDVRRVAEALGYADASAFIRAFRRWSGTTPARWRSRPPGATRRR